MSQPTVHGKKTATMSCRNCGQPLQGGSPSCMWCGVNQEAPAPTMLIAPAPRFDAHDRPDAEDGFDAKSPLHAKNRINATNRRGEAARGASSTSRSAPDGFVGVQAGAAKRLASFTIDVVVIALIVFATGAITHSCIASLLALVELLLAFWVVLARTGLTVGHSVLRLRVARDDAPYSPGIGRAFVRLLFTAIGFFAAGVGAWVVVGSGAWDPERRARAWPDRVTKTIVLAVPVRKSGAVTRQDALALRQTAHEPLPFAAPQVVSTTPRPVAIDEDSVSAFITGSNRFEVNPLGAVGQLTEPSERMPLSRIGDDLVADKNEMALARESAQPMLLLIFDTGQRDQMETPVTVNMGRNPVASEPRDRLLAVTDTESTVSKTHLRLEHSRGRTWVTDGGSTNGTEIISDDGQSFTLTAGERVLLDEGARVRIGNRTFTINLVLESEKES